MCATQATATARHNPVRPQPPEPVRSPSNEIRNDNNGQRSSPRQLQLTKDFLHLEAPEPGYTVPLWNLNQPNNLAYARQNIASYHVIDEPNAVIDEAPSPPAYSPHYIEPLN